ncbi:mitogen-activated protein kinase kinase kinase 14 [Hoplias malabaricus]|uniref:mitogen-activated protein kinase kinase kinase 14 n=1 Tax=Hoplias malabaricus TaxID=27720 RepID=UPI0034636530
MLKEAAQDKDQGKLNVSEGFLFHPRKFLQAKNSEYREGREYSLLRNIQNGSYGDVFSVRDKQTGFTCAAKRIPLCSFSWEEVGTWSRLDSPRVLQLYGAVREGLNVVLFMDLKTGSLAQLLKTRGSLPEDLSLFYHTQVLQALEHLHSRKVIHLDVKVDNVLLSKDRRECFLCDFGSSEMLDQTGCSTKTFRGNGLRGTETHMSPEVARGDPRSDKADVWSSCCMLLHMLSGHQPWTRYYTHPLCLKIVSEPAPLWEIPPGCDPLTREVIRGGLVKEPRHRDSARKLLEKSTQALRAVSGSSDPVLSHLSDPPELQNCPPISYQETPTAVTVTALETPTPYCAASASTLQDGLSAPVIQWVSTWRERAKEEDESDSEEWDSVEESEWDSQGRTDEGNRYNMRAWMERYWGIGKDLPVTGHMQHTCSQNENEKTPQREGEDHNEMYTEVKTAQDEGEDEDQVWHGSPDEADSEDTGGTDGTVDEVLDVEGLYEAEARSSAEETEGDSEGEDVEEVESDLESLRELGSDWAEEEWEPFHHLQILYGPKSRRNLYLRSEDDHSDSEESRTPGTPSVKQNSNATLTCHRSTCASEPELTDKNSDCSDDLSSGVFSSYSSLTEEQSFNVDWSVSTNLPPSCCFEGLGVDIWVEDVSGETLRIREKLKVKLGHVAVGISAQISMRTFSLATLDGKLVSPETEVLESGMWLQCVPAPDGSTCWDWRVRDGKLEQPEHYEGVSDTCSTLAA